MSYQVLARKWRPRTFDDTVGQAHVRQALGNALDSGRLHHAYLFSGTRGVGKTTLARIFAKALNCEEGVSASPCGVCSACQEIDAGRFVDLIEVDAASRTRVDDTREILDNVQYAPARGRFKVYLIDEVHMLSTHSFNALLKTLEEPPEHVKFLLATTDPQKLPVTVLSRCLQFNLKRIDPADIEARMAMICSAEELAFDAPALHLLARAAAGSMRDGLSLLDQAIAFGAGEVREGPTREILGTVEQRELRELFEALAKADAAELMAVVERLDAEGPDYGRLLAEIASTQQRAAVYQACKSEAVADGEDATLVPWVAGAFTPEDLQLGYQMAINGLRDLNLAPEPRGGFEMTLLRLLVFRPAASVAGDGTGTLEPAATHKRQVATGSGRRAAPQTTTRPSAKTPAATVSSNATAQTGRAPTPNSDIDIPTDTDWYRLVPELTLTGVDRMLASNCAWEGARGGAVKLSLDERSAAQFTEERRLNIEAALTTHFGGSVRLTIERANNAETPAQREERLSNERLSDAERSLRDDPNVKTLQSLFGAELDPGSVRVRDKESVTNETREERT